MPLSWLNLYSSSHREKVTARKATEAEEKKVISEGPWQHVSSVTQAATHSTEFSQRVYCFLWCVEIEEDFRPLEMMFSICVQHLCSDLGFLEPGTTNHEFDHFLRCTLSLYVIKSCNLKSFSQRLSSQAGCLLLSRQHISQCSSTF